MAKRDENEDAGGAPKQPAEEKEKQPPPEVRRRGRMITAKDAGWITPTAFVAPITLVPIDPPRPIKKRRPRGG